MTFCNYLTNLAVLVACAGHPAVLAAVPTTETDANSLSAAANLPNFPAKPADLDQATWTALNAAVATTIPEAATLTASDGEGDDAFGYSVALSGNSALVGAYLKTIGSNTYQGVAYVFTFNGSTWVQQQELTASDGAAGDDFGSSVALADNVALVGAYRKTVGSNGFQGAAYVFTFNGGTWVQQQELTASDGSAFDQFGWSVALSGTTALVGAESKTIGLNSAQGAAYVFTFNGSAWDQQRELTANDGGSGDYFGYSVALSGTTALVGAYLKTVGSNGTQGSAYVFTFNGSTWIQQQD
jgi:FG-GAP repeat